VHIGDLAAVRALVEAGACDAGMRDASEHSVLWHAIAFGHMDIAGLMLDTFPPGGALGVDLAEMHPRKGDTLLHLLCQSKSFGSSVAHVFRRVATAAPPALFQQVNINGMTFLQIAAASLNFWVLTFTLRKFPERLRSLVCAPRHPPLRGLAEAMARPAPPSFAAPGALPGHLGLAALLQQDDDGAVPYADVAFDVGPDCDGVPSCRFLAHRIVVASQSPVLFAELEKLPLTELPKMGTRAAVLRVDPRIPQEVWRSALQFMYTGVLSCTYEDDIGSLVELLRACALYKLPEPLSEFAQSRLYPLLPRSPPEAALEVFAIARRACPDVADPSFRCVREASAYLLLRSAHHLFGGAADAAEASALLEYAVQVAEHAVFNPAVPRGRSGGWGPPGAAPGAAPGEAPAAVRGHFGAGAAGNWQAQPHVSVH